MHDRTLGAFPYSGTSPASREHVTLTRYNLPAAVIVPVSDAKKLANQLKAHTISEEGLKYRERYAE